MIKNQNIQEPLYAERYFLNELGYFGLGLIVFYWSMSIY